MSTTKRKRKGSKGRRKKKRNKRMASKSHQPKITTFPKGVYVKWRLPGEADTTEGRVLRDNGYIIQVARNEDTVVNISGEHRHRIHVSGWRNNVQLDSIVFFYKEFWIPCVVRGIQGELHSKKTPQVLVIEPVFFGATISVPTLSLRLRAEEPDENLKQLLQSGYGFDDSLTDSTQWAKYKKTGDISSTRIQDLEVARLPGRPDMCFVVPPPCKLPEGIVMIRRFDSTLQFIEYHKLNDPKKLRRLQGSKKSLGTLKFDIADSSPFESPDGLLIPCLNACKIARNYYDCGDAMQAAKIMRDATGQHTNPELVDALLVLSGSGVCDKYSPVHPVARVVWQHGVSYRPDRITQDLVTLGESLERIQLFTTRRSPSRMQQIDNLRSRVTIWMMYAKQFAMARRLQVHTESYNSVDVQLKRLTKSHMHFKVSVVTPFVSYDFPTSQVTSNTPLPTFALNHISEILNQFTATQTSSSQCPETAVFDKSNWEKEVARISAVPGKTLADLLFAHEMEACSPLSKVLNYVATAADGSKILWNPLQGPLMEEATQPLAFPRCLAGGVVVVQCYRQRMETLAKLFKKKRHGQFVPTLLIAMPTVLYQWQQVLESHGISCFVYHGPKRQKNIPQALERRQVILTTCKILQKWTDLSFFVNSEIHQERIVLDIGTVLEDPMPYLLDSISKLQGTYLWMLNEKITMDSLAIALPLLNIQPFSKCSGWAADLVSDFRRREFVRFLLYNKNDCHNSILKKALHKLVEKVYFVAETCDAELKVPWQLSRAVPNEETMVEVTPFESTLLKAFKKKLWVAFNAQCAGWSMRQSKLRKSWHFLTKICYGKKVSPKCYGEIVSRGNYTCDPDAFIISKDTDCSKANGVVQSAKDKLKLLIGYKTIDDKCPICFENLCNAGDEGDSSFLSKTVVVGACGHTFCGECADQIFRVAHENAASGNNDYGFGDNSINIPRCPLCRDYWNTEQAGCAPLIIPTQRDVVLIGASSVYKLPSFASSQESYTKTRDKTLCLHEAWTRTPLMTNLLTLLENIFNSKQRCIIFCSAIGLAEHLSLACNDFNIEVKTDVAATIHSSLAVKSRGNSMKRFTDDTNTVSHLFLSATMVRGLCFPGVTHFVFADRVNKQDVPHIVNCIKSSCRHAEKPPQIYTMWAPSCAEKRNLPVKETASVLCSPPNAETQDFNLVNLIPILPETEIDYIESFHNIFEEPLPAELLEKYLNLYQGSAQVAPIDAEEDSRSNHTPFSEGEEDIVQYLTQAETEEIIGAGIPHFLETILGPVIRV